MKLALKILLFVTFPFWIIPAVFIAFLYVVLTSLISSFVDEFIYKK